MFLNSKPNMAPDFIIYNKIMPPDFHLIIQGILRKVKLLAILATFFSKMIQSTT